MLTIKVITFIKDVCISGPNGLLPAYCEASITQGWVWLTSQVWQEEAPLRNRERALPAFPKAAQVLGCRTD